MVLRLGVALLFVLPLSGGDDNPTIFNHSDNSRFWAAGQINVIHQQHPSFPAKYTGENSLQPTREKATSRVLTLYTGIAVTKSAEILFDLESTGGRGLSDALGLAGFTNLDVVRNPSLGSKPYVARILFHAILNLRGEPVHAGRNFLSMATEKSDKRLEIYAGKLSLADLFDANSIGTDSHLQFMNWTVDNNGAYDYAADTRGYTWGVVADYEHRRWAVRFAEALMPKVANGIDMDWNIRRARSENLEWQWLPALSPEHKTTIRVLSYLNHANMGSYPESIDAFLERRDVAPDIEAHRRQGRKKYGFGINGEQHLTDNLRMYSRAGWNEGRHESFAYTEVNSTAAVGADVQGNRWKRPADKLGIAAVTNGISGDHRRYLELGGHGFLLGDGALRYGRENIVELYYTAHVTHGISISADLQHIRNPGYNRDRGPVWVPGARLHLEF